MGVEFELMAPPGTNRRDLACALAGPGGTVTPVLHQDSEPSKVPGQPIFYNLTQGFAAHDVHGRRVAHTVDDITLQADLNPKTPPKPGWWRIVSDDRRVLHLARRHGSRTGDCGGSWNRSPTCSGWRWSRYLGRSSAFEIPMACR